MFSICMSIIIMFIIVYMEDVLKSEKKISVLFRFEFFFIFEFFFFFQPVNNSYYYRLVFFLGEGSEVL